MAYEEAIRVAKRKAILSRPIVVVDVENPLSGPPEPYWLACPICGAAMTSLFGLWSALGYALECPNRQVSWSALGYGQGRPYSGVQRSLSQIQDTDKNHCCKAT